MAIAKMKRLHLIALQSDRQALMARMLHLGCVHLAEPAELPEDLALRRDTSQLADRQAKLRTLRTAQAALQRWAPAKGGLLTPRPQVKESEFLDDRLLEWQLQIAEEVNGHTAEIERLQAAQARLRTEQTMLLPWRELDIPLREGVYFYCYGPQYETPAEIRAARVLGGDAVGMSTAPEVIVAGHCGMEVLGFTLLSNMAAGILDQPLTEEEVLVAGVAARVKFSGLIRACLRKL